jgi:hypothetical protein
MFETEELVVVFQCQDYLTACQVVDALNSIDLFRQTDMPDFYFPELPYPLNALPLIVSFEQRGQYTCIAAVVPYVRNENYDFNFYADMAKKVVAARHGTKVKSETMFWIDAPYMNDHGMLS